MSPLATVSLLHARPGCEEQLGRRLSLLAAVARNEPGCLCFEVQRADAAPALWLLYAQWSAPDAAAIHLARPAFSDLLDSLPALIIGDVGFSSFSPAQGPPLALIAA